MSVLFHDAAKVERWRTHLNRDHVSRVTSPQLIVEKNESGQASLTCNFEGEALYFRLGKNKGFYGLLSTQCADAVLVLDPWGAEPHAHVFELMRTVKCKDWQEKIKPQFYGALIRVAALGSLCDIRLASASCHIAFQQEKITRDPALLKLPSMTNAPPRGVPAYIDTYREWTCASPLCLPGIRQEQLHLLHIKLAPDGTGQVTLPSPARVT